MVRRRSPAWTLFLEGDRVVASAGADALFLLDELSAQDAKRLHALWERDAFAEATTEPVRRAIVELERAGAIVVADQPRTSLAWAVVVVGVPEERAASIAAAIGSAADDPSLVRTPDAEAELVVLVRAGGTLLELADRASNLRQAHLLVDLTFHHTLTLGPLVFPGETACLTCLAGRIRFAWGDPPAAPEPVGLMRLPIAAAWVRDRLFGFRDQGTCASLVNRCVAIDMDALTMRGERVFRLPWCTACFPEGGAEPPGSFALPWNRPA